MIRVQVKPELLRWACERSLQDAAMLRGRFPHFEAWQRGEKQPTFKQLEAFARATHTPIGFLFLPEPPVERVPIADLRTPRNRPLAWPSPDLLDTLYLCQQRQDWYREFAQWVGDRPREYVGSVTLDEDVPQVAARIRKALQFDIDERRKLPTRTDALRRMVDHADQAGVLVMVSGVVGSDNHRRLDPDEFRGFALVDPLAPLVFVNGADAKAAQLFTLAHELAHVWLGETALSNLDQTTGPTHAVERFCDQVAAELLVPLDALAAEFHRRAELESEVERLARLFKVSTLVVLRRLHDAGHLSDDAYRDAYRMALGRSAERTGRGGGDFYRTLGARVSKRFARAVVVSALEGRAPFTEAFRLLGFRKMSTFNDLGVSLGVVA